ncbi:DinB family protein [Chitinophaga solisilvae]|uniref:DinB family protein n=1 Tax=Chitinophaga solisilvae TaxID=1233460 RepID=A0A3S1BFE3_9BACT|nr:DinB family protein [Chitinophaga solisilvae]NSL88472.1 DinB family protein [Chitinophaga solisilvae]
MYLNQHEIRTHLSKSFDDFVAFIQTLPDQRFTATPYGKWSAGQQLHHLIKCARPVGNAMSYPKLVLRYFGTSQQPSRSYNTLVEAYQHLLDNGATATRAYWPGIVYNAQRPVLIQAFLKQRDKLQDLLSGWSEQDLDKYRLPHPILGKITVREMLYFTTYHNEHHLQQLRYNELQSHTWENQLQQLIF